MKRLFLASLAALAAGSAAQAQMNNKDLKWAAGPDGLPKGSQVAVLSGDPAKEGMFTIRLKFPANYSVAPHQHPTDELVTVIDGQQSIGMGDTLDRAKATALSEGGYIALPAKMNHYGFTRTGATIQITSHGPFQITYLNPKDDPRTAKPPEAAKPPERGQ